MAALPAAAPMAAPCATPRIDEWVQVRYVIDGDTVVLADGRKLRFVGIDAPELGRHSSPGEPLAPEARAALQDMLAAHQYKLGLRYDQDRRDTYGRVLAHGFFSDGAGVSPALLARGLAIQMTIPPNIWNAACYQRQEMLAERSRRGVWALIGYRSWGAAKPGQRVPGFRLIRGRVSSVSRGRRHLWIHLKGGARLGILYKDLNYFTTTNPNRLPGRRVEARGYLQGLPGREFIQVRHPVALRILIENGNNKTLEHDHD